MAKKTAQADPESATTQVNIADFQRTRDSVCFLYLIWVTLHFTYLTIPLLLPLHYLTPPRGSTLLPPPQHYLFVAPHVSFPTLPHATNMLQPPTTARLSLDQTQKLEEVKQSYHSFARRLSISALNCPNSSWLDSLAYNNDQVIVALATLQSSVQDLSRAYIQHANTVLAPGKHGLTPIDANLTSILTESGLLTGRPAEGGAAPVEVEADGKKKRKRTPHDPNAPKRALTPYFLYMQSARATIAKELGDSAKPKEVADEGTRRWTEMSPAEKSVRYLIYCSVPPLLT
jgi:hypothetical protein